MTQIVSNNPVPASNESEAIDDYAGGYADINISEYEDLPDENLVI